MHIFSSDRPSATALTALALLAFAGTPVLASSDADPATAAASQDADRDSRFGAPLVVNGEVVPDKMILRYLVYGPGRGLLEIHKRQTLIDDQIKRSTERLAEEGKTVDPLRFHVTEEEWLRAHDERVGKFSVQFPFLDLETELRRAYGSVDLYERAEKQMLQFDKVFLPQNPNEWPIETVEAIRPEADGMVLQDAYKTYDLRKAKADAEGTEMGKEGDVYMNFLRDVVESSIISTYDVRTFSDGIDPDLALVMNDGFGEPELVVTLEQLYDELQPYLDPVQIEQAKLFCARIVATRQALERDGALMPLDEFNELYKEYAAQSTSFFTLESVALYTDYFPSIEHFKAYFRLSRSHTNLIEPEMTAPEGERLSAKLKEHLPIANKIMGLAKAEVEVLLVSAFDTEHFRWKDGGWEAAKEQTQFLKDRIEENTAKWKEQQKLQLEAAGGRAPHDVGGARGRARRS